MEQIDHLKIAKRVLYERLMAIGFSQSHASELARGKKRPTLEGAALIEEKLEIPAAVWATRVPLQEMWNIIKRTAE